jgi:hypothetical protein
MKTFDRFVEELAESGVKYSFETLNALYREHLIIVHETLEQRLAEIVDSLHRIEKMLQKRNSP